MAKKRKPNEVRPIMTRLPEALRSRLERAAARNERSMNAEISFRLESSFSYERAFGGGAMTDMALRMAVAFSSAGGAAAAASGHPRWTPDEWIQDETCYRTAMFGVIRRLLEGFPGASLDEAMLMIDGISLMIESLKGEVATTFINERSKKGNE